MNRWCRAEGRRLGAIITLKQAGELARAWYHDRLSPAWRRKSPAETAALFQSLGLASDFWGLTDDR